MTTNLSLLSSSSSSPSSPSRLDEPPSPRRSDEAFILAVRTDIQAARARASWAALGPWKWAPLSGLAMAGLLVAVTLRDATAPPTPSASEVAALVEAEVAAEDEAPSLIDLIDVIDAVDAVDDEATLLALHGSIDVAPSFAFAELDGSNAYELANIEAAFDRALAPL